MFNSLSSIDTIMSFSSNSLPSAAPFGVICATYIPFSNFTFVSKYGITSLSYAYIPIVACSYVPVCLYDSIIVFTTFIGIANPIPSAVDIFTVFIPYYFSIWIY